MSTTYVSRTNSNAEAFRRANDLMKSGTAEGEIPNVAKQSVKCDLDSRMKRLTLIYKMNPEHPVRHITLGPEPDDNCDPGHGIPQTEEQGDLDSTG